LDFRRRSHLLHGLRGGWRRGRRRWRPDRLGLLRRLRFRRAKQRLRRGRRLWRGLRLDGLGLDRLGLDGLGVDQLRFDWLHFNRHFSRLRFNGLRRL
jgi:hypothetical protein